MLLPELLRALPVAQNPEWDDIDIREIVYDSRRVHPGALFVAVPSVGGDRESGGARFLHQAVGLGAAAIVTESRKPIDGSPVVRVPDAREALGDLASHFFGHPARALDIYAVTGTDGKTTTTYLLEQILASAGSVTGLIGTVEIKIGEQRTENLDRMTTPESLDLQGLLRKMLDAGVQKAAIEASSHALALHRLRGCSFAGCAVTNITADHVEFHGSWERYFESKSTLFTEHERTGAAVLNRDDDSFHRLAALIDGPMVSYGCHTHANVRACNVVTQERGSRFDVLVGTHCVAVDLPLPGRFNVSNALAAAAMAVDAGVPLEAIADALSHAEAPPGRMQRIETGQPFQILVDYAHTMNAFRSVLSSLRERTSPPNQLIAVFGATGDRDRAKRPVLARLAREYTDFFIITNEDPYGEPAQAIIDEIASGVAASEEKVRFIRECDRGRAIGHALERAAPGDTVVILGKGHEQSIVVNGNKEPWSDVEAVRRSLQGVK